MEEIEEKYILLRKDGYKVKEAGELLGKNKNWATREEKKVVGKGLLTKEDIENGKDKKKRKEMEENPTVQRIFQLKLSGMSDNAIANLSDIELIQKQISRIVADGIRLGLLDKNKMNKAREEIEPKAKKIKENQKAIEAIDKEQLLGFLILGYDLYKIKKKMKVSSVQEIKRAIKILVKEERITEEEIEEYRDRREKEDKEKILEGLKAGLSIDRISKNIDNSIEKTKQYIEEIKIEENITDQEIEQWKNSIETDTDKRKAVVLIGLEAGLTSQEMCDRYKKQKLDPINIEYCKKLLIEEDPTLPDRIKKARQRRTEEKEQQRKEKITKIELLFLEQALQKIPITSKDIITFSRLCAMIQEYTEALNLIRSINQHPNVTIANQYQKKIKDLEYILNKVCKVKQAIQMINRDSDTIVISNLTGLSRDEVSILKIRIEKKPIKFLSIKQRKQVLEALMNDKDLTIIQRKIGMNDFERYDIEDQFVEYRKYKAIHKEDNNQEIDQDIRARIVVLFTKLGRSPEHIAKAMKQELETIEKDIEYALQKGWINEEELRGIDPLLCYKNLKKEYMIE